MKAMKAPFEVRQTTTLALALSLACFGILFAFTGCGNDNVAVDLEAQRDAALAQLQDSKQTLDDRRQELVDLREHLAAGLEEGAEDADEAAEGAGDAVAETAEEMEIRAKKMAADLDSEAEALGAEIVNFINENPPLKGEPLTERQKTAVDLKVQEDIVLANEWIEKGGDYARALNVLEPLKQLAPESHRLLAELERIGEMRYVTEERFAGVKKGQTDQEVREILGPANLRNIREYEGEKIAWFYSKAEGGAAGVFFRKKSDTWTVYQADFNAVKPNTPDAG